MTKKIRILFLSANPWVCSRILVDEEAREIFERLQEGPYRDKFELHHHAALRPGDLQKLLLTFEPHIVHFSGHASKKYKIILGGSHGRGKTIDHQGLTDVFALYKRHVRLVVLNACFTREQAHSLSQVVNYSIGAGRGIGDKVGVAFAGAFYRALGFGKSVRDAFASAKAELALTRLPRSRGIELFLRDGLSKKDLFPRINTSRKTSERRRDFIKRSDRARPLELCQVTAAPGTLNEGDRKMPSNKHVQNVQVKSAVKDQAVANGSRDFARKAPGTRLGTLQDWRGGYNSSRLTSGRHGHTIRDGR